MHNTVKEIIKAAASAPSVANSQPWFFSSTNSTIYVHLDKKRADSFGNAGNTVSYVNFGAVIENIIIAAHNFGFDTKLLFFPEDKTDSIIVQIDLVKVTHMDSSLFEFIFKRHTNRRPFKREPIPALISKSLIDIADSFKGSHLYWISDQPTINRLALLIKQTDTIMYEHPRLHADLFKWIRWTGEEVIRTGDGLSIKSLEVSKLQEAGFKFLSSWKTMNFLNRFGVSRFVSNYSYKLAKSSAAIGLIVMDSNIPEDFINGGRLFERIWITATSQGLSLHPMCPIVVLTTIYLLFGGKGFGEKHQKVLRHVYDEMVNIFPIKKENALIILFRVGYAMPPTERSLRRPINEVLVD
jgi:hypothetical protein